MHLKANHVLWNCLYATRLNSFGMSRPAHSTIPAEYGRCVILLKMPTVFLTIILLSVLIHRRRHHPSVYRIHIHLYLHMQKLVYSFIYRYEFTMKCCCSCCWRCSSYNIISFALLCCTLYNQSANSFFCDANYIARTKV